MIQVFRIAVFSYLCFLLACSGGSDPDVFELIKDQKSIAGQTAFLHTPYVTAGDRMYMVGHQDGTFPPLGWHVPGEMGGIWNHPIKLMDGFTFRIVHENETLKLKPINFTNFPFGNIHHLQGDQVSVRRFQFVPDGIQGLVVAFDIVNLTESPLSVTIELDGHIDLMPVWLSELKGTEDGADSSYLVEKLSAVISKDKQNPWFVVQSMDLRYDDVALSVGHDSLAFPGNGHTTRISKKVLLPADKNMRIHYRVSGSYQGEQEAIEVHRELTRPGKLLKGKIERMTDLNRNSRLLSPDDGIDQMFEWTKYTTDWLIRDVPETGRGVSAGMPDYPWWFGADNAYTLQGLLATGRFEEVRSTIDLVMKLSREVNGNGRVMHEASTNGVVFNPGNLNETPHFIYMIWQAYLWTGDRGLLEAYYHDVLQGLEWIEGEDKDKNGYPDGPGMMEIDGLHTEMIDVVVYLQQAYAAAAQMARVMEDTVIAEDFQQKAAILKEKINREWWVEEMGSFADFRADKAQTLELIAAALVRADTLQKPLAMEELRQIQYKLQNQSDSVSGRVVHHNWVVNTPMEMGIAEPEKAFAANATARQYRNRFGMYVTGMDRNADSEESAKWKAFSYVGAVMTLPTGVQAIAEARYGNPNEALNYLKMLQNSFSYALPGSLYEVSPDYGMIAQAWTIYAVAVPVVNHFFGIKPDAAKKTVHIQPIMPKAWEEARLQDVRVGDNLISLHYSNGSIAVKQAREDWQIKVTLFSSGMPEISGTNVKLLDAKFINPYLFQVTLSGTDFKVNPT